ncbi:MAG: hypothetical protein ABL958_05075 [Bdellovibrionia bacterium]
MSVDGVKGQEAAVTSSRREAKDKEEALIRKHQSELARMARQHKQQIENLQKQYETSNNAIKRNAQESLSQKDQEYQKDMQDLREMHKNNYNRTVREKDQQYDSLHRTTDEELVRHKERSSTQLENQKETFENELSERKQEYNQGMTEARGMMQESLAHERDSIVEASERDKKYLRDNRNKDVNQLQTDHRKLKASKESEVKDLKNELWITKNNLSEKFEDEVDRMESTFQSRSKEQKEGYDGALEEMREDNKEAQIKRDEQFTNNYRDLRNEARARQMSEITRLERKIADEKYNKQESLHNQKRMNQMEKKAFMGAIGQNIKAMEESQKKASEQNNLKTSEAIRNVQRKNEDTMVTQREFYRDKINTQQTVFDDAFRQQVGELKSTIKNKDINAKAETDKTRFLYANELKEADERLKATITVMKRQHEEEMKDLKLKSHGQTNDTIVTSQNMMREAETKYNQQQTDLIRRYEEKVTNLTAKAREAQIEERDRGERLLKESGKQTDTKLKAQAMQYESKIAQLKEQQDRAVQNMKNQLDEQRISVATRVQTTNKQQG